MAERPQPKLLFRPTEAAALLNISRSKLYEMLNRGQVRTVRVGGIRQIPLDELARLAGVPGQLVLNLWAGQLHGLSQAKTGQDP